MDGFTACHRSDCIGEHNWVSMRSGITKQDTLEQQEPVQMWRRDLNPRP